MSDNTKTAAGAAITNWNCLVKALRTEGTMPAEVQRVLAEIHDDLMPLLKWAARYGEWPHIEEEPLDENEPFKGW